MLKAIYIKINDFFSKGHERTLLIKKNITALFLIKSGSIIIGLFLVPMTINYINPIQYGVWLTLSSIISWFSFFDIGLGNGLRNKLAETNALAQNTNAQIYVSTTYALLTLISFGVFLLFFCINQFLNWDRILNTVDYNQSLNDVALIVVGFFCISFVVQLINMVLTSNHKPAKSSLISLIGSFFSITVIYILTKTTSASLIKLVLVLAGIPLLIQTIATVWLFKTSLKKIAPSFRLINLKYAKDLLNIGSIFFFIQIGAVVLFQTDNIIITQLFGPGEVTTFNIPYKLFSVISMAFSIMLIPFWSAFTDAYTKNDIEWIKNTISKMQKYWLLLIVITISLLVISPLVFRWWIGNQVKVPFTLSLAMAFYIIAYTWQTIHVFLLNGINKIRLQLYLVVISAIINVPLAVFLSKRIGLAGVTLSNTILFVLMGFLYSIQCKKILNNTATGIWAK